jgi:single-strand DNA-binding protein
MPAINRVTLMGFTGRAPELRRTQGGKPVTTFSVATTERYRDQSSGQWVDGKTEWMNIVVWGEQAERAAREIVKGDLVSVEGKLRTRKWTDDQGIDHYSTEVHAYICVKCHYERRAGGNYPPPHTDGDYAGRSYEPPVPPDTGSLDDYDIGDLGPPLDMDSAPYTP